VLFGALGAVARRLGREASLPYAECDGQQWRFLALIELGDIEAADAAHAAAHAAKRWPRGARAVRVRQTDFVHPPGPGRLTERTQARRAMAQAITTLPPTFFAVRAHAARERDDRAGAREAFERALAQGLLELPRGPTWTMTLTWAADICAWLEDRPGTVLLLDLLTPSQT
jgi:hypothetical protein